MSTVRSKIQFKYLDKEKHSKVTSTLQIFLDKRKARHAHMELECGKKINVFTVSDHQDLIDEAISALSKIMMVDVHEYIDPITLLGLGSVVDVEDISELKFLWSQHSGNQLQLTEILQIFVLSRAKRLRGDQTALEYKHWIFTFKFQRGRIRCSNEGKYIVSGDNNHGHIKFRAESEDLRNDIRQFARAMRLGWSDWSDEQILLTLEKYNAEAVETFRKIVAPGIGKGFYGLKAVSIDGEHVVLDYTGSSELEDDFLLIPKLLHQMGAKEIIGKSYTQKNPGEEFIYRMENDSVVTECEDDDKFSFGEDDDV